MLHETTPRHRIRSILVFFGIVVAVGVAFFSVLGPERGLYFRDHLLVFRPLWWSTIEQLRDGTWPILNIADPMGGALERSVNSALYTPLTGIFFLGPFDLTYDWFVAAHFVLLGSGAALLARRLGASFLATFVAGGTAMLAGPVFSFENLVVGLQGLSYAPWVGWLWLRFTEAPTWRHASFLALGLAFQLQAMMPELVLIDLLLVAFLWLARPTSISRVLVGRALAASFLALGLAAVDIVPMLEGLIESRRILGLGYDEQSGWAFHPWQVVEFVAPNFWAPTELAFFNVPFATGTESDPPYLTTLYLGTLLPLALSAPRVGRRFRAVLWLTAAVFLLISMGHLFFLHRLISALPILSAGRYAIKYLLVVAWALAALSVLSFEQLDGCARQLAILAAVQAALGVVLLSAVSSGDFHEFLATNAKPIAGAGPFVAFANEDIPRLAMRVMGDRLWFGVVTASCLFVLAAAHARWTGARLWTRPLVALLAAADLAGAGYLALASVGVRDAKTPASLATMLSGRDHRVFVTNPPPTPHVAGNTAFEDFIAHHARFGHTGYDAFRRYVVQELNAEGTGAANAVYDRLVRESWPSVQEILRRAGVRLVVRTSTRGHEPIVETLSDARPYAYATNRWTYVDPKSDLSALVDPAKRDVTIVFEPPDHALDSARTSTACHAEATLDASRSEPSRVVVDVDATCTALVVVEEFRASGWTAAVDGTRSQLVTTEVGYLGTFVGPGAHRVEFAYETRAWPTVVSLASLLVAILFAIRKAERTPTEPSIGLTFSGDKETCIRKPRAQRS